MDFHLQNSFLITHLVDPLCSSWIIPDFTIPHAFAKTFNGHLKKTISCIIYDCKKNISWTFGKKAFHGHLEKKHFMFTSFIMFGQGFDPTNFRLLIVHLQPLGHFLNGKSNLKIKFNLNLVKIIKDYESHIRFD